jgi:hypothetical protein
MRKFTLGLAGIACILSLTGGAGTAAANLKEFNRGYNDCLRGDYDQLRHGASYKRGCRAAEESGKATGHQVKERADANMMRNVCKGAVIGRFNPHARSVKINSLEHQNFGWGAYGLAVLDDGSTSDFVCMFSSTGVFKRVNASEPTGASYELFHEEYCPPDVTEADRYKYPGCNM